VSRAWELLALRLLAVTIIGGCLALQIDGAEQVVRTARAVAAWAALLIALAVLAVAGLAQPVVPGRRRAIAVASIGFAVGAALGWASAALVTLPGGEGWTLVAAVTVGLAVGARAGIEAERRLTEDAVALPVDSADAYAAHVRRLRARGALATAASRGTALREHHDGLPVARAVLVLGLGGLALLVLLRGLEAVDAPPGVLLIVLVIAVPALLLAVGLAGLLMTLPLSVAAPAAAATARRRLAQRVSWIQPLPDLLASALVSLLVQTGPTRRRPEREIDG